MPRTTPQLPARSPTHPTPPLHSLFTFVFFFHLPNLEAPIAHAEQHPRKKRRLVQGHARPGVVARHPLDELRRDISPVARVVAPPPPTRRLVVPSCPPSCPGSPAAGSYPCSPVRQQDFPLLRRADELFCPGRSGKGKRELELELGCVGMGWDGMSELYSTKFVQDPLGASEVLLTVLGMICKETRGVDGGGGGGAKACR